MRGYYWRVNMKVGSKVEHRFTGEWMFVLQVAKSGGQDKVLCRLKDHRELWFFDFELKQL
jgi:hypothetical protein